MIVSALVTAAATALSYALPDDYVATGVALVFLGATWWLVLRSETDTIRRFGLSLGGLLEPSRLDARRLVSDGAVACLWALGCAAVVFPPFFFGYRVYWHPARPFALSFPASPLDEMLGQLLVVALPEEAFFRGYLMTALDDRWGTRIRVLGVMLGPSWIVSSAIFAAGHLLTEPYAGRLAVFFPALLFGWLRARTGGVGAPTAFHALCNLFAATLARSYGLAP